MSKIKQLGPNMIEMDRGGRGGGSLGATERRIKRTAEQFATTPAATTKNHQPQHGGEWGSRAPKSAPDYLWSNRLAMENGMRYPLRPVHGRWNAPSGLKRALGAKKARNDQKFDPEPHVAGACQLRCPYQDKHRVDGLPCAIWQALSQTPLWVTQGCQTGNPTPLPQLSPNMETGGRALGVVEAVGAVAAVVMMRLALVVGVVVAVETS